MTLVPIIRKAIETDTGKTKDVMKQNTKNKRTNEYGETEVRKPKKMNKHLVNKNWNKGKKEEK